jgi:hypothetical protein
LNWVDTLEIPFDYGFSILRPSSFGDKVTGGSMNSADYHVIGLIVLMGSLGSLVSAFVGDSGWHLPMMDHGIFRPGYLGNMLVGALAALASWGMQKAALLIGGPVVPLTFSTADMANAIVIGFGGASWFKSQLEKGILQKAAVVAASKPGDPDAATQIAASSPMEALKAATNMKS